MKSFVIAGNQLQQHHIHWHVYDAAAAPGTDAVNVFTAAVTVAGNVTAIVTAPVTVVTDDAVEVVNTFTNLQPLLMLLVLPLLQLLLLLLHHHCCCYCCHC